MYTLTTRIDLDEAVADSEGTTASTAVVVEGRLEEAEGVNVVVVSVIVAMRIAPLEEIVQVVQWPGHADEVED